MADHQYHEGFSQRHRVKFSAAIERIIIFNMHEWQPKIYKAAVDLKDFDRSQEVAVY